MYSIVFEIKDGIVRDVLIMVSDINSNSYYEKNAVIAAIVYGVDKSEDD